MFLADRVYRLHDRVFKPLLHKQARFALSRWKVSEKEMNMGPAKVLEDRM